jgi:hypothetical protein
MFTAILETSRSTTFYTSQLSYSHLFKNKVVSQCEKTDCAFASHDRWHLKPGKLISPPKKLFPFWERKRGIDRATSGTQLLGVMHLYNINAVSSRERLSALQLMRKTSIIPLPSIPTGTVWAPFNEVKVSCQSHGTLTSDVNNFNLPLT